MGDSNKQVCRLCLKLTPPVENDSIEDIKNKIQEVLPTKMDFDITERAVACAKCVERLQDCSDFKLLCINTFVDVSLNLYNEKVLKRQRSINDGTCLGKPRVCWFCMCLIEDNDFSCVTDVEHMIRKCCPKLDLTTVREFIICKTCLGRTKRYYEFINSCQEVDQRIDRYCRATGCDTTGRIVLEDLLKFKESNVPGMPVVIKEECLFVENVDASAIEHVKTDEIASIKCEEIDFKDELDCGSKTCEFHQIEDNDDSSGTESSPSKKVRDSTGKLQLCPTLPFKTDIKMIITHYLRKKKDLSDVMIHNCPDCPFKSKNRSGMRRHWWMQHDTKIDMHKCTECPFVTKYKGNLQTHQFLHKRSEGIGKYKRSNLEAKPIRSQNKIGVRRRWFLPQDTKETHQDKIEMYKCTECPFVTKYRGNLRSHQLLHKITDKKFKCKKCSFSTRYNQTFKHHQLVHKFKETTNAKEDSISYKKVGNIYKCEKCPYENSRYTTIKQHLKLHSVGHQFSCDVCNYLTNNKRYLVAHMPLHQKARVPPEQPGLECDRCEYRTSVKATMDKHQLSHKELSESEMYVCTICDFKTKCSDSFRSHTDFCLKMKKICNKMLQKKLDVQQFSSNTTPV